MSAQLGGNISFAPRPFNNRLNNIFRLYHHTNSWLLILLSSNNNLSLASSKYSSFVSNPTACIPYFIPAIISVPEPANGTSNLPPLIPEIINNLSDTLSGFWVGCVPKLSSSLLLLLGISQTVLSCLSASFILSPSNFALFTSS